MNRRYLSSGGVPGLVAAALLFLPAMSMAQHHGGGGHGGGHASGGHGGGGHGGGHASGGHNGGWHDGGFHGGHGGWQDGGFHGGFHHNHYYGGYPYWGGYYPGFYYYPDAYDYAVPQTYGYFPQYSSDYQSLYAPVEYSEAAAWDQADQRVTARISVPKPDAQLWVEGQEMTSTGTTRSFVSPPLESGKYTYTFRARWSQDGNTMDQTRRVRVQPGDRITVDFSMPESK